MTTPDFDAIIKRHRPKGWRVAFSKRRTANSLGAEAIGERKIIRAPYVTDPETLHFLLHEFGHVHLKHWTTGKSSRHREEFEAERWAAEIMRIEGVPVSATIKKAIRAYIRDCIAEDQSKGVPIEAHVARFARVRTTPLARNPQ